MNSRIHDLLEIWERSEKKPTPEQLCADCPELLPQVRSAIAALAAADAILVGGETASTQGDVPPVAPPVVIPGYSGLREISRGGQGVVYSGVFVKTGRRVAVKVMREGPLADARQRARFEREAQILAALNHPNIVTVLDRGQTSDGSHYLAMDFVTGKSLDAYLTERMAANPDGPGSADPSEVLRLFMKICDAINTAHLRGIIHRDLKPSNIIVDDRREPRILDFGLARSALDLIGGDAQHPVTITGQFLGSLPWASPEQANGQSDLIDPRTDVYSLGVILYQLLTGGKFPYKVVGTMREVLDNILLAQPTPPSKVLAPNEARSVRRRGKIRRPRPALNPEIESIVLKALSKRREDRFQNAGEFARAIANYLSGFPSETTPTSTKRVLNLASIGAGAAAVVVVAALVWRSHRPGGHPDTTEQTATSAITTAPTTARTTAPTPTSLPASLPPQALVWIGEKPNQRSGFEKLGQVVSAQDAMRLYVGSGTTRSVPWRIARLYRCNRDVTIEPKTQIMIPRDVGLWSVAQNGFSTNAMVDPAQSNEDVACIVSLRHLPDGPYCLYAGSLSQPDAQPAFATTFVVGGLARPRVESQPVKASNGFATVSLDIVNDGDGELNEAGLVITAQENQGSSLEFRDRWEERPLQPIAPHKTFHYERKIATDTWHAGRYQFMGHLTQAYVFDDEDRLLDFSTESFRVGDSPAAATHPTLAQAAPAQSPIAKAPVTRPATVPTELPPTVAFVPPTNPLAPTSQPVVLTTPPLGPTTRPVGPSIPSTVQTDPGNSAAIDFMGRVDPTQDALLGDWEIRNGALVGASESLTIWPKGTYPNSSYWLLLPYEPPDEYDLRASFTRAAGDGEVELILSHAKAHFCFALDFGGEKHLVGFKDIDPARESLLRPSTVSQPAGLKNGQRYAVVVHVRRDGLTAELDGRTILHYPTGYQAMRFEKLFNAWEFPPNRLGVGATSGQVSFDKIEVSEVGKPGILLKRIPDDPNRVARFRARAPIRQLRFMPDGLRVCASYGVPAFEHVIKIWDLKTGQARAYPSATGWPVLQDGRFMLWVSNGLHVQDVESGVEVGNVVTQSSPVTNAVVSPDGRLIAEHQRLADHSRLVVWDVASGNQNRQLGRTDEKEVGIMDMCFSPDSKFLAASMPDATVHLWNVEDGKELWHGPTRDYGSVAFSADGKLVLAGALSAGHSTKPVNIYRAQTGELLATLHHDHKVCGQAFSPNGRFVFTADENPVMGLHLWEVANGQELERFTKATGPVECVAFAPGSANILAGCKDGTVRLIDSAGGEQIAQFEAEPGLLSLAFSGDGRLAAAGGQDGSIHVWRLPAP